ncbi:MAG: hypothetical protein WCS71_05590 [Sphaerochaetaceae bacterium]
MIKNPSQTGEKYQIFTLIIRDPALFKNSEDSATATDPEKSMIGDMQKRMEKAAEEYKAEDTK